MMFACSLGFTPTTPNNTKEKSIVIMAGFKAIFTCRFHVNLRPYASSNWASSVIDILFLAIYLDPL